jgi:ferrous-iron efflux pump FieF
MPASLVFLAAATEGSGDSVPGVSSGASSSSPVRRLAYVSAAGSFALAAALVTVFVVWGSRLALAQAADSISDLIGGAVLAWAVRAAARPADADHPLGHTRAEPLAALLVAVLASLLAFEVLRTSVVTLLGGTHAVLEWPIAGAFGAKVAFKGAVWATARRELGRGRENPALAALRVDARNDVLVSSVAIVGFAFARRGYPSTDAWLAIPIAVYVGLSAIGLARESIGLVMGEAAPPETNEHLTRTAADVPGVVRVDELIATWAGSTLHVQVEIAVAGDTAVRDAHDVAEAVKARLSQQENVAVVVVHVNPAP